MSRKMMTYIPTGVVVPLDESKFATGLYEPWPKSESLTTVPVVVAEPVDASSEVPEKKPSKRKPKTEAAG
jgi:hypothetical protein